MYTLMTKVLYFTYYSTIESVVAIAVTMMTCVEEICKLITIKNKNERRRRRRESDHILIGCDENIKKEKKTIVHFLSIYICYIYRIRR